MTQQFFGDRVYKNSSGGDMANVNFFTTTSYTYRPAPTPILNARINYTQ